MDRDTGLGVRGRDPLFQRRRLLRELRRLRRSVGLTQREAAHRLEWSPSKLIRIEAGTVGVSITDVRALLAQYGLTDPDQVDDLLTAARDSRKAPWWEPYRDILDVAFQTLLGFESAASVIREFHPLMIPGLLQTEAYTRALFRGFEIDLAADDRLVHARLDRQRLLDHENRPELFFILDEAAIRRTIGGAGVMARQLRHLKEVVQRPGITIQVVDLKVGAHGGLAGPFIILELACDQIDQGDDKVIVFLETLGRNYLIQDDVEQSRPYLELFEKLAKHVARPKEDTVAILDAALGEVAQEDGR